MKLKLCTNTTIFTALGERCGINRTNVFLEMWILYSNHYRTKIFNIRQKLTDARGQNRLAKTEYKKVSKADKPAR